MFRRVVDYAAPKPVDPLWYQPNGILTIRCRCGRVEVERLSDFTARHRLDKGTKIYEVIRRLRCRYCGERPAFAEVARSPNGNRQ